MHSNFFFFFKLQNRLNSSHAPTQKWICFWESVSSISFKKEATKPLSMQNNSSVTPVPNCFFATNDVMQREKKTSNDFMFFVSAWTKKVCVDFFKICLTEKICWRLFWRHPLMMSAQHFSSKMLKRLKECGFCRKV